MALRILGGGCDLKVSLRDLKQGQLRDEMGVPPSLPACTLLSLPHRTQVCGIVDQELVGQTCLQSLPGSKMRTNTLSPHVKTTHRGHKENCAAGASALLPSFVI